MPQPVGRPPWATPEQSKYLEEHLPSLDDIKAKNGLTQLYARVTRDFSEIWKPPIVEKDRTNAKDADDLKKLAYDRRGRVSQLFFHPPRTSTDCYYDSKSLNGTKNTAKPPPRPLSPSLFST